MGSTDTLMTDIADRAWWSDVEHLRPDAEPPVDGPGARTGAEALLAADEPSSADRPRGREARRGRITGRVLEDAMDLDGAFGAPSASRSREIVLTRGVAAEAPEEAPAAVRGQGSPDRRTVRITGNPGHTAVAARRTLRELQPRRGAGSTAARMERRPDRIALWAVLLGIFLVVIAAMSSSAGAAPLAGHHALRSPAAQVRSITTVTVRAPASARIRTVR